MPSRFTLRRRVEFAETDMAGIMHFAHFFRYMEAAEHAFFRSIGMSVHGRIEGRLISWPRVDVSCRFTAPLKFEDEVDIEMAIAGKTGRSLTCAYEFRKVTADGAQPAAVGRMTLVCVEIDPSTGAFSAVPIPASVDAMLEVDPAAADTNEGDPTHAR